MEETKGTEISNTRGSSSGCFCVFRRRTESEGKGLHPQGSPPMKSLIRAVFPLFVLTAWTYTIPGRQGMPWDSSSLRFQAGGTNTTGGAIHQELSRHKNQSADWYLFHGLLTNVTACCAMQTSEARGAPLRTTVNFGRNKDGILRTVQRLYQQHTRFLLHGLLALPKGRRRI